MTGDIVAALITGAATILAAVIGPMIVVSLSRQNRRNVSLQGDTNPAFAYWMLLAGIGNLVAGGFVAGQGGSIPMIVIYAVFGLAALGIAYLRRPR